jgi:hypothetical protein
VAGADWNDARERIGTGQLLQQAQRLDWGPSEEIAEALSGYERFVIETLIDDDATVSDDSRTRSRVRLYNFPGSRDFCWSREIWIGP